MRYLFDLLVAHPNEANAIAATANTLVAFFAFTIAIASIIITIISNRNQIKHNKLSVRPIPRIITYNYSNLISVELINNGIGPLIIKNITAFNEDGAHSDLISILPSPPTGVVWDGYMKNRPDDVLYPDHRFELIRIFENNPRSAKGKFLSIVRTSLAKININIEYTDIYGDSFEVYKYDFSQTSLSLSRGMATKATDGN